MLVSVATNVAMENGNRQKAGSVMTNMGTQYGDVLPKCDAMQVAGIINRMAIDHHLESATVIYKLFGTGVVIDISSSEQRENCSGHCMTVALQFGAPTRLRGFGHNTWV